MNASLEDHNKELQYKLEEMKNQLQEREKLHSQEKAEISQEINALKSKLTSIDDELQKTVFKKTEMMAMIQSSKGSRIKPFNSLIPDLKMHILLTVLHTFLMELVRGICLNIKRTYPW